MNIQDDINNQEGKYNELTYEKLKGIIEDVMFHPREDFSSEPYKDNRVLIDAPEGWEENRRKELLLEIPPW